MNDFPKISIITAVKNAADDLESTILSVQNQPYPNLEFIVIDSESKDGTSKIIQKYQRVISQYKCEADSGIYDAWNKGVNLATGEWLIFLGSGDELLKNSITDYVTFINASHNSYNFISSKVNLITLQNKVQKEWGVPWSWAEFKKSMRIAHVGAFHHHSLFEVYGLFDTSYKIAGDYEFLMRPGPLLMAGFFDKVTANMKLGGISLTNNRVFLETIRAKYETAGRPIILCYWEAFVLFSIVKIKNAFMIT